eukprot:5225202-Amphidinium_carterae.1
MPLHLFSNVSQCGHEYDVKERTRSSMQKGLLHVAISAPFFATLLHASPPPQSSSKRLRFWSDLVQNCCNVYPN